MKTFKSLAVYVVYSLVFTVAVVAQNESYVRDGVGNESYQEEGNSTESILGTKGEPLVRDGLYDKVAIKEKQILNYDHIREADVFWQKRVWRVIDTKQKINKTFSAEGYSLIGALIDIIQNYEDAAIFMDEKFTQPMTLEDLRQKLNLTETITVVDPITYKETIKVINNEFDPRDVTKIRLKEDWVFDEESSQMIVRIIGIAPVRDVYGEQGEYRGQEAMFWAYYPKFRKHLVRYESFNSQNDMTMLSWDDILEMRYFNSYIMKESNIYDRRISEYAAGKDALIESERIKQQLFEYEHNLWSY